MKKISLSGLEKVLSEKEMKNIIGKGYWCTCGNAGGWWESGANSCSSAFMNALELCGQDGYGHNALGAFCDCY
jgi:natural product precursor